MARYFVKQPDGKIAIWSTVVDNFTVVNCTEDEAYSYGVPSRFAPTWDEAIKTIRELHGKKAVEELAKDMNANVGEGV